MITVLSSILSFVTLVMSWEFWMILLITAGCFSVWILHITKLGADTFYENLCAGVMLIEFFFFSVHESSLYDIPAMACIFVLALFMLNKKWILHTIAVLYVLALLYHGLILRTISAQMEFRDIVRIGIGAVVTLGGTALARYWVNRRNVQRKWYEHVFEELETAGKQNAVFLSNVSHDRHQRGSPGEGALPGHPRGYVIHKAGWKAPVQPD